MQGTGNGLKDAIYSNGEKALEMLLKEHIQKHIPGTIISLERGFYSNTKEHRRCPYKVHLQLHIKVTGNAPDMGLYSNSNKALEMSLKGAFTETPTGHWKCP